MNLCSLSAVPPFQGTINRSVLQRGTRQAATLLFLKEPNYRVVSRSQACGFNISPI